MTIAWSYSWNHQTTMCDDSSTAVNPYLVTITPVHDGFYFMLIRVTGFCTLFYHHQNFSLLCIPFWKTSPLQQGLNIDMTNTICIFIKVDTLLLPLLEAILLYAIIWQTLNTVRLCLLPIYTLDDTNLYHIINNISAYVYMYYIVYCPSGFCDLNNK